jgi:hypothetical protein
VTIERSRERAQVTHTATPVVLERDLLVNMSSTNEVQTDDERSVIGRTDTKRKDMPLRPAKGER